MKLTWQNHLHAAFRSSRRAEHPVRAAIVGIGSELHGDDYAGVKIIQDLQAQLPEDPGLLLIEAGMAPENFTGTIRRFAPDLVLLLDSAQMGAEPGEVRWLDWRETVGMSGSTHTLPPYVLAQYLVAETGCEMALLGIQPASLEMGSSPSAEVQKAVEEVVEELLKVVRKNG